MKRRGGGERDGTDASGSAAALPAPRRRLASRAGEGGPRGDAVTTFISPGGSREVGGPKSKWPPAGRAHRAGGRVRGSGRPAAPAAWTLRGAPGLRVPGAALSPRRLCLRGRPGHLSGRRGGGDRGPEPHECWGGGRCRPCRGPGRAGRGRAAGRGVSVRAPPGRTAASRPGRRIRRRGAAAAGTFADQVAHFQARLLHNTPAKWGPGLTVPIIPNSPLV